MSKQDLDLDKLLKPLKELKPSSEQMGRWQSQPKRNQSLYQRPWFRRSLELAAAAVVGFVIGALYFQKPNEPAQNMATNFDSTATTVAVFIKGE